VDLVSGYEASVRVSESVGMQYYTDEILFGAFCTNFPPSFFEGVKIAHSLFSCFLYCSLKPLSGIGKLSKVCNFKLFC
jgi:hypothetical protein